MHRRTQCKIEAITPALDGQSTSRPRTGTAMALIQSPPLVEPRSVRFCWFSRSLPVSPRPNSQTQGAYPSGRGTVTLLRNADDEDNDRPYERAWPSVSRCLSAFAKSLPRAVAMASSGTRDGVNGDPEAATVLKIMAARAARSGAEGDKPKRSKQAKGIGGVLKIASIASATEEHSLR
jgi:hypothetical protein